MFRERQSGKDTERRLEHIDCILLKEYYANGRKKKKNILEWTR